MNDRDFHQEQLGLFAKFSDGLQATAAMPGGETLAALAEQFAALVAAPDNIMDEAPALVFRMLTIAPQLAEHFPRDLLWYLGGECLHFMPDDEIQQLTLLDEQRRESVSRGETFNWREARASLRGLQ
jgi:hypothetical protein